MGGWMDGPIDFTSIEGARDGGMDGPMDAGMDGPMDEGMDQ